MNFPLARYRFDFTVETPLHLPDYAGSALRGAFGGALRRIVCLTREKDCKPCGLYRTCPYPQIFETPPPENHALQKFSQIPNPYVIEPPPWGERIYQSGEGLSFHLVLAGRALAHLPFIVLAWQRALAHGVGKGDGKAGLRQIVHLAPEGASPVYSAEEGTLPAHATMLAAPPPSPCDSVRLHIETPLRLQDNGKPLGPDRLEPRDLLVALVRRIALIAEFHTAQPLTPDFSELARQAQTISGEKSLHWRDWTRYSSRQRQAMALGGVVGEWRLTGEMAPFLPYLYLGQWLHVGKNATFGLGKYRVAVGSATLEPTYMAGVGRFKRSGTDNSTNESEAAA